MGTAHGQGGEGWGQRVALTKGAVTVAVVGAMVQKGVRDATGVTCKTGGSLSPSEAPLSHLAQRSSHQPCPGTERAQSQGQSWHLPRSDAGSPGKATGRKRQTW